MLSRVVHVCFIASQFARNHMLAHIINMGLAGAKGQGPFLIMGVRAAQKVKGFG